MLTVEQIEKMLLDHFDPLRTDGFSVLGGHAAKAAQAIYEAQEPKPEKIKICEVANGTPLREGTQTITRTKWNFFVDEHDDGYVCVQLTQEKREYLSWLLGKHRNTYLGGKEPNNNEFS